MQGFTVLQLQQAASTQKVPGIPQITVFISKRNTTCFTRGLGLNGADLFESSCGCSESVKRFAAKLTADV